MSRFLVALFTLTSFVAAFLLFSIQPLVARLLLPPLGGSPMVWNTAMVFFQAVLLGGYGYAHWIGNRLGTKQRRPAALGLHALVLLVPLAFLPIHVAPDLAPPNSAQPIGWLLGILFVTAGVPFFLVSTCSPFLQRLFAVSGDRHAHDPYFLYAASNAGSLGALLAYPTIWEPNLGLSQQGQLWRYGYMLLIVLLWACSVAVWKAPQATEEVASLEEKLASIAWKRRGKWLLLAFVPSSLMLGLTSYLSSDVAAIPLLWIVPLSLYLISFMVVFARRPLIPATIWVRALAIAILPLAVALAAHASDPMILLVPLHCGVFLLAAIVCHGELVRDRPPVQQLTEFYAWMALGGVLGGAFNSLLSPLIFREVIEYPLTLVLVALLLPRDLLLEKEQLANPAMARFRANIADLLWPLAIGCFCLGMVLGLQKKGINTGPEALGLMFGLPCILIFTFSRRPLRFALALAAMLATGTLYRAGQAAQILDRERSFFGVHRVLLSQDGNFHMLSHGATMHGVEDVRHPREPLSYYSHQGPIGDVMKMVTNKPGLRVGAVGLGAGTLAAYIKPSQKWTFYEIDPRVVAIASNPEYFKFLSGAPYFPPIVVGDARLKLKDAPDASFDLLVLDAYSSDTIPVHLLTREAFALYRRKLAPGGLIAWHLSNNHFDLEPVVGQLARDAGWAGLMRRDTGVLKHKELLAERIEPSQWAVVAQNSADLGALQKNALWHPLKTDAPLWTDENSSLWTLILRSWRAGGIR